jgi:hypothetical protein
LKTLISGEWSEHNLAKVGVEGSNPFARSRFIVIFQWIGGMVRSAHLPSSIAVTRNKP